MKGRSVQPKRSLRSELMSLALLMSLPTVIAMVFPWQAIGWSATLREPAEAMCEIVNLSEIGETAYLEAAKSAWQLKGMSSRERWINLAVGELPAASVPQILPKREPKAGDGGVSAALRRYRMELMPPTAAATEPQIIAPSPPIERRPAFSRTDLLDTLLINETTGN